MDISDQKTQLRRKMLKLRKSLSPDGVDTALFLEYPFLSERHTVAAYWPMAGELDVRPLLSAICARAKTAALPVVIKKEAPLLFRQWTPDITLEEGPHNTVHPGEMQAVVDPDVIIVPLLAFDLHGGRLGFGGGYYDRTLAERSALKVAVAYDEQQVSTVPMDIYDQRMDWIITPTRAIEVAQQA